MAILINYFNHVTEQKRAKRLGFSGKKVRNLAYMLTNVTVKSMFPVVLLKLRWHACLLCLRVPELPVKCLDTPTHSLLLFTHFK